VYVIRMIFFVTVNIIIVLYFMPIIAINFTINIFFNFFIFLAIPSSYVFLFLFSMVGLFFSVLGMFESKIRPVFLKVYHFQVWMIRKISFRNNIIESPRFIRINELINIENEVQNENTS